MPRIRGAFMSVAAVIASGTTSIAGRTVLNLVNCFSVDRKLTAAFFVSPAVKADVAAIGGAAVDVKVGFALQTDFAGGCFKHIGGYVDVAVVNRPVVNGNA